jgi:two-component system sensor histidine kinase CpxA
MDLPYPRLYLRMAIYIGATLAAFILVGAAILALIASYELKGYVATRHSTLGHEAAEVLAVGGRPALQRWLNEEAQIPPDVSIFILDQNSDDIFGRHLPGEFTNFVRNYVVTPADEMKSNYRPLRLAPQLVAPDGQVYAFLVLPKTIGIWGSPATFLGLITVALLVIGSVAWLIASRFGRPIGELQAAVRQLTSGHIEARVPAAISSRRDELGALAADFNSMADQLQNLMDSREQLMQEMSHELRSPLARLQASLALAAHRQKLDGAEREQIEREVRSIDQTIGEMLRFSRLDAPAAIAHRLIRVGKLLRELVDVEEIEAQARGCQLELTSERNLQIIGDPDLLRSGFENILRNAIRYAPTDSCVELTAKKDGTSIVIQISDRGPGIPEQFLDRIFEPFFRVKSNVADASGSGLGLAIAQRAFEVHGGSIVATPRDGGGLIFTVTLPAADLT